MLFLPYSNKDLEAFRSQLTTEAKAARPNLHFLIGDADKAEQALKVRRGPMGGGGEGVPACASLLPAPDGCANVIHCIHSPHPSSCPVPLSPQHAPDSPPPPLPFPPCQYFSLEVADTPAMVIHDPSADAKYVKKNVKPEEITAWLDEYAVSGG